MTTIQNQIEFNSASCQPHIISIAACRCFITVDGHLRGHINDQRYGYSVVFLVKQVLGCYVVANEDSQYIKALNANYCSLVHNQGHLSVIRPSSRYALLLAYYHHLRESISFSNTYDLDIPNLIIFKVQAILWCIGYFCYKVFLELFQIAKF